LRKFAEFRQQFAEVGVQPTPKLRRIRLVKLVKLLSGILQVPQGLFVVFLDFFPYLGAIDAHQRATVIGRAVRGSGITVGLSSWRAAFHRSTMIVTASRGIASAV
jgi:hypothetical protein